MSQDGWRRRHRVAAAAIQIVYDHLAIRHADVLNQDAISQKHRIGRLGLWRSVIQQRGGIKERPAAASILDQHHRHGDQTAASYIGLKMTIGISRLVRVW